MKARLRFYKGKWWCRCVGAIGCGSTIEGAWRDMQKLYRETVRPF